MATTSEQKYIILRKRLDQFGYKQPLAIESLPLVEKLFQDLIHTTEALKKAKDVSLSFFIRLYGYLYSSISSRIQHQLYLQHLQRMSLIQHLVTIQPIHIRMTMLD